MNMLTKMDGDRLATIMDLVLLRYGLIALAVLIGIAVLAGVVLLLRRRGRGDQAARLADVVVREVRRGMDPDGRP